MHIQQDLTIDVLNNQINIPVKTKKFESRKMILFTLMNSISRCWYNTGGATSVKYIIGEVVQDLSIPTRTIHIPNHPFKTGQKVTLFKSNGANRFDVGRIPNGAEFKVPQLGQNSKMFLLLIKVKIMLV